MAKLNKKTSDSSSDDDDDDVSSSATADFSDVQQKRASARIDADMDMAFD